MCPSPVVSIGITRPLSTGRCIVPRVFETKYDANLYAEAVSDVANDCGDCDDESEVFELAILIRDEEGLDTPEFEAVWWGLLDRFNVEKGLIERRLECVDGDRPGAYTHWTFYEGVALCSDCVSHRHSWRNVPCEWYIED